MPFFPDVTVSKKGRRVGAWAGLRLAVDAFRRKGDGTLVDSGCVPFVQDREIAGSLGIVFSGPPTLCRRKFAVEANASAQL